MQKRIKKWLANFLIAALVLGLFPADVMEVAAATVKSGYEILVSPTLVYENMYRDVENHRLAVENKNGKEGLIDINNNVIIPFSYDQVNLAADGEYAVVTKDEKYGLYNATTGKKILGCEYVWIDAINRDCILVYSTWESVNIYNSVGEKVVAESYGDAWQTGENYLTIYKNNKYGLMTLAGEVIFDCVYDRIELVDNETKVFLQDSEGICALYNLDDGALIATLGTFDWAYDGGEFISARKSIDTVSIWLRYNYDGSREDYVSVECYGWEKTAVHNEEQELIYIHDETSSILYIYNYELEQVATFEHVVSLHDCGMFEESYSSETESIHRYCVYDGEEKRVILDYNEISYQCIETGTGDDIIIVTVDDNEWRVYAADGSVATFTGKILDIESYVTGSVIVEYEDSYVLADYNGEQLDTVAKAEGSYVDLDGHEFFLKRANEVQWLYGTDGKQICAVGTANDDVRDVTNSYGDSANFYIRNDSQNKAYILDGNQKYLTTIEAFDYYYEFDDAYISVGRYNDTYYYTNEIIGFDGVVHFDSDHFISSYREDNGRWLAQTCEGVWEVYETDFTKIASLGECEYVSYDSYKDRYHCYTYGEESDYEKIGVFSGDAEVIIPIGNYTSYYYDYDNDSWALLADNNKAVVYNAEGTKLCTIPSVKEIRSYHDGYMVFKSTNNKYGIYKVTGIGHTHKYKTYSAKDATTSKNGYTSYKKCTICGDVTGKTTIYAASKISASDKTYTGKKISTSISVKDSKGKTISKSYYSVSGTTKATKVGTYKVKIKLKGKYSGTKTITWKIKPTATKITKATAGKKLITLKWSKKTKEVTGYQIQYSTDKNFKKSVKTTTIKSYRTTSKTIKSLKAKKTYYVRVRTYKTVSGTKHYSSWSSVKKVKTK